MTESTQTDVMEVLGALDNGFLADKIGAALSEMALKVCVLHELSGGKAKGKLILSLEVGRDDLADDAIKIKHKLVKLVPHKMGKYTDETNGKTVMFVARGGKICECQPDLNINGQHALNLREEPSAKGE